VVWVVRNTFAFVPVEQWTLEDARTNSHGRKFIGLTMKILGLVPALALLVACNSGSTAATAESPRQPASMSARAAIYAAQSPDRIDWPPGTFPDLPGSKRCAIFLGGDYSSVGTIPAVCSTQVTAAANGVWLVTFTETWNAHDVSVTATGSRSHSWNFLVPASGQGITLVSQTGDVPPQHGM